MNANNVPALPQILGTNYGLLVAVWHPAHIFLELSEHVPEVTVHNIICWIQGFICKYWQNLLSLHLHTVQ